jgi:hypothetical protein
MENIENQVDNEEKHFSQEENDLTVNVHDKSDNKQKKINLPKRKYAIIHGYNGHNYSGNQKYLCI